MATDHIETIIAALDESAQTRGAMTNAEFDHWRMECAAACQWLLDSAQGQTAGANADGLLPCPFCGGECEIMIDSSDWMVGCKDELCNATGEAFFTRQGAIGWWNRRTLARGEAA